MSLRGCVVVAIEGTHASGKTTLVHALTAHYRARGVLVDCTGEPARTSPFIEETVIYSKGAFDLVTEVDLFAAQLTATLRASRHHDLLICDKTIVNVLAYARIVLPIPPGSPDAAVLDAMAGFCGAWVQHAAGYGGAVSMTAGLLLAAGGGRRYGMPKALVERDGLLLVERGLATLRAGGCDPLVVVLGAAAHTVTERANLTGAQTVTNPDWARGMGSSLRAGLAALQTTPAQAAVILLVDTPGITAEAVRRVLAHADPSALAVATYHGERGHPVLLGRDHWAGVARLAAGDVGARPYLREHHEQVLTIACEDIADGTDLDEPA